MNEASPQPRPRREPEGVHHPGTSSAQWLRFWMPAFRLGYKLLAALAIAAFCYLRYGMPYLRIEYTYQGSPDNIISATYWGPNGKRFQTGRCPMLIWVKEPIKWFPASSE